jgi:flagellar assembly protein FliH
LSKVYKSFSVNIKDKIVIENFGMTGVMPTEITEDTQNWSENEVAASAQDITHVRNQADEILCETEQMVKELIETARQESEKIIKSANEEARRIITEGQDKLKQVEEEAYRKGNKAGFEEGTRNAEKENQNKMAEAVKHVERAHEERLKIVAGSEDEIVQLAVAVARKIIDRELLSSPEIIVNIVKRAIGKATDREELTVRVNPDSIDGVISAQDKIVNSAKGIRKLKFLADPNVSQGGCVIESLNGTVDARVERQLSEIEQALTEVGPNV